MNDASHLTNRFLSFSRFIFCPNYDGGLVNLVKLDKAMPQVRKRYYCAITQNVSNVAMINFFRQCRKLNERQSPKYFMAG